MARYIIPPNTVVQGAQPVVIGDVQYPQGVGVLTQDERDALGITTVVEHPMPDPRYGTSTEDPAHPGEWLYTPFTPEEMVPRLADYSAKVRFSTETGGFIFTAVSLQTLGVATARDTRSVIAQALALMQDGDISTTSFKCYEVDLVAVPPVIKRLVFVPVDGVQLKNIWKEITLFVDLCFNTEATTKAAIDARTITLFDQIDAVYAPIEKGAMRGLTRGAFGGY